MANFRYTHSLSKLLSGDIDLLNDKIYVSLIRSGSYTPDQLEDEFLSVVSPVAIASSVLLTGKFIEPVGFNSTFGSDDCTFPSVAGEACSGVLVWKDFGDASISPVIAYFDTGDGLPATPDGSDISLNWLSLTNKIFSI